MIMLQVFGVKHGRIAVVGSLVNHIIIDGPSLKIKFVLLKIRQGVSCVHFLSKGAQT